MILCGLLLLSLLASGMADPLRICLMPTTGWCECSPDDDPSAFTGFDVELFRETARLAGWTESVGSDTKASYRFVCTQGLIWPDIVEKLANESLYDECAGAAGEFVQNSARWDMGVHFSTPYYRTGLAVLIKTGGLEFNSWAFMKPFQPSLWIVFIVTIVSVPMIVWVYEQLNRHGFITLGYESVDDMRQATYTSMLAVFNLSVFKVKSFAAQLTILCFCFLIMITMATYVANLAAALAVVNIAVQFDSIHELVGKKVATHFIYQDRLKALYNIDTTELEFSGVESWNDVRSKLTSGVLDAYVMDFPQVGYYTVAYNDDCTVRLLPRLYSDLQFGFMFHKNMSTDNVAVFNQALLLALEANKVEDFGSRYLLFEGALDQCTTSSDTRAINVQQLAGLWVIIGAVLGLSFLLSVIMVVRRMRDKKVSPVQRSLRSIFVKPGSAQHLAIIQATGSIDPFGSAASLHAASMRATSVSTNSARVAPLPTGPRRTQDGSASTQVDAAHRLSMGNDCSVPSAVPSVQLDTAYPVITSVAVLSAVPNGEPRVPSPTASRQVLNSEPRVSSPTASRQVAWGKP